MWRRGGTRRGRVGVLPEALLRLRSPEVPGGIPLEAPSSNMQSPGRSLSHAVLTHICHRGLLHGWEGL